MLKIQGLFKAFECLSSTFQSKFNFQGLFKTVLYIQVLFKPVRPPGEGGIYFGLACSMLIFKFSMLMAQPTPDIMFPVSGSPSKGKMHPKQQVSVFSLIKYFRQ